jgi:hypothetical protein
MKKVKLVLIATLLTLTVVGISKADGFTGKTTVKQAISISIDKALQDPGLVVSMSQQLNIHILIFYMGPSLRVDVFYQKVLYRITGTREQWLEFFHQQGKSTTSGNKNG